MNIRKTLSKSSLLLSSIALVAVLAGQPAIGKDEFKLVYPEHPPTPVANPTPTQWTENTLLVMPSKADEDAMDLIKEVDGTITETIGEGELTVWVVKFKDTKHFAGAQKTFSKDKNIKNFQRDYLWQGQKTTNDPYFPQQWYLSAMKVPLAWDISQGGSNTIGIIDTGVVTSNVDLSGKCFSGYDVIQNKSGQTDVYSSGHGTMVATTAAAIANNGQATAGPACLAKIYPVCACAADGYFSSAAVIKAIQKVGDAGYKLINLSVNGTPPNTIANAKLNSSVHTYFKWFHDKKGGLIFNAAGNRAMYDPNPRLSYLIVVNACDSAGQLASFSNWGAPLWFTAPGVNIVCSQGTGQVVTVSGTSFASPLACSVAALVWGRKPSLKNTQVEKILRTSASPHDGSWNQFFGYGLPDAQYAFWQ